MKNLSIMPVSNKHQKLMTETTVDGHQWLIPVILATQEAEIRRIAF
jgi:hypothetical protein